MKCSNCGNEFGDGVKCQHCGVDRVIGLGYFYGFRGTPGGEKTDPNVPITGGNTSPYSGNMLCFSCGEIIPSDSEYCPHCGKEQYVKCPKCGFRHLLQYPICYKCGTNRVLYLQEQKAREAEERRKRLEKEKRDAEERRLLEEARRRKEEELRKLKEKERREAVEKEKQRREWQERQRLFEINWTDAFLSKERENVVRDINNAINKTKKEYTHYKASLIITCVIGILCFLIAPIFSGGNHHDIAGVGFFFVLPCCMLVAIGLGITLNRLDNTSPRNRLINFVSEKYYLNTNRRFSFLTDNLFESLFTVNGIVFDKERVSLSGSDITSAANVYIQRMIVALNKKKDFVSKSWRDKHGLFKNYLFNNTILSPEVADLVNNVLLDGHFWDFQDCTNRVSIKNEVERVYLNQLHRGKSANDSLNRDGSQYTCGNGFTCDRCPNYGCPANEGN